MSKTLALRTSVRNILTSVFDKVFYAVADDSSSFPYCVYTLQEVTRVDGVSKYELELNCCDYGRNTAELENKCDQLTAKLDYLYQEDETIAYTVYFARRNNVASEDLNVIRRRLVFDLNLYVKGE